MFIIEIGVVIEELTTASMAHRQWMSSDSLYLSRFSGTAPSPRGSNPKSLQFFQKFYTDESQLFRKIEGNARSRRGIDYPGAEPSR